jgi:hypothetical protein
MAIYEVSRIDISKFSMILNGKVLWGAMVKHFKNFAL